MYLQEAYVKPSCMRNFLFDIDTNPALTHSLTLPALCTPKQTEQKTSKCFYLDFNISMLFPFSIYKMPNKKQTRKKHIWIG